MRVWLVTIGEPVPGLVNGERLHRTGSFANWLAAAGHEVLWWTSTFNHFQKKQLAESNTSLTVRDRLHIRALHGVGYSRNMSFRRMYDHIRIARQFRREAYGAERPDVIVAAFPTVELSAAAVRYGLNRGVPVLLDIRDLWPDIFVEFAPAPLRSLARLGLSPLFAATRYACRHAAGIIGITDPYVDWGLRCAGRSRSLTDGAFPFAYNNSPLPTAAMTEADRFWDELGIKRDAGVLTACYFGGMGHNFDLSTIIAAARLLARERKPTRFVLCGTGDNLDRFRREAAGLQNVFIPGWVNAAQIRSLMQRSDVGLDPLPDRFDFLGNINNKAVEYLSGGLPVLSCPDRGTLADLVREQQCGISYAHQDTTGLAALLTKLSESPDELNRIKRKASSAFEKFFLPDTVYGNMALHVAHVASSGAAGNPNLAAPVSELRKENVAGH